MSGCPGRGLRRGLRAPDLPAGHWAVWLGLCRVVKYKFIKTTFIKNHFIKMPLHQKPISSEHFLSEGPTRAKTM